MVDVYCPGPYSRSIRYLICIRDLENPKGPYPFWGELKGSLQRRGGDPDEAAQLVGIQASGLSP